MYAIPCNDTGHIIYMLILQSCTDSLHSLPGLSNEKYATPSDGVCNSSTIGVEEDVVVIEERSTTINKEVDIGIKQEEIPEDITFSGIKSEPDEVSSMCVCLLVTHITSFHKYCFVCVCDVSIFVQLKQLQCCE